MTFLLDTHVFLWLAVNPSLVPLHVLAVLEKETNSLFVSSISVWEIEQKFRVGKLHLHKDPEVLVTELHKEYDIGSLAFDEESAFMLGKLPILHGDPFDRMLICQSMQHSMTLVTGDRHIRQYPVKTLW